MVHAEETSVENQRLFVVLVRRYRYLRASPYQRCLLGEARTESCLCWMIDVVRFDLDLFQFPADVQDLTISITSHHHVENCLLVQDEQLRSSINREAFVDQQKWSLYAHVATEMRQTQEEYSFDDESNCKEQKKHSVLSVTCRAGWTDYWLEPETDSLLAWSSSSTWVLLLECLLFDLSDYC